MGLEGCDGVPFLFDIVAISSEIRRSFDGGYGDAFALATSEETRLFPLTTNDSALRPLLSRESPTPMLDTEVGVDSGTSSPLRGGAGSVPVPLLLLG